MCRRMINWPGAIPPRRYPGFAAKTEAVKDSQPYENWSDWQAFSIEHKWKTFVEILVLSHML